MIIKGDQYILPIPIYLGTTLVTPSNVDDVEIQLGDIKKTYSKSELTYSDGAWNYYMSEEQSLAYEESGIPAQVGIKNGSDKKLSSVKIISVGHSILGEW